MAEQWPIVNDVPLTDIALDVRNVRLAIEGLDEPGIASYLVESDDLLGLARDLLRDGYIDNEIPIVVEDNGKYIVLEANRRVAALKAIHDPAIIGRHASTLERHLSRYPDADTPTAIRVMVAPTREAAQPVLARLHTGQPKRAWIREQQAIFYHARLSDSVDVDDLKAMYPREAAKIVGFIRMGEMRELIRGLRYDDPDLEEFVKSSGLKMTSLEYAYDRPRIMRALDLEFGSDGLLKTKRVSVGQRRGLMYLLRRFKAGTLNTRSPELRERSDEHPRLVAELERIVSGEPASSDDGAGSGAESLPADNADRQDSSDSGRNGVGGSNGGRASGSPGGSSDSDGAGSTQPNPRVPNRGDTRNRLDMNGFSYQGTSDGMRRRFEELSRLDVRSFPNAAYDLLRTLLECSIKEYFIAKGQPLAAGTTIGGCVSALAPEFQRDRRLTPIINMINRTGRMTAGQYQGSVEALNATNHNPDAFAVLNDVHEAWDRIKPILIATVG